MSIYSISESGYLRNDNTKRILKTRMIKGYHYYNLYDSKYGYQILASHRLVAFHFLPLAERGKIQVNHKDGNKLNNHFSNLEWVTPKENSEHAVKSGLFPQGETHHLSKTSDEQIREIRRLWETGEYYQYEIAKMFSINQSEVSRYINHKRRGGRCG